MKLLLDSVILIDHFNGIAAATNYLSVHHADAAVSLITRAEVLTGFEPRAARRAVRFLDAFRRWESIRRLPIVPPRCVGIMGGGCPMRFRLPLRNSTD